MKNEFQQQHDIIICQAFRLLQKTFQHTATGTEPVRPFLSGKVNNIRGMALESQEEFDAALGDGSKADTARKAFIKLRGELTHLYQMQCSLRTAAQSDSETALVDDLLADLEKISRKAHEQTHFTYTTLEEIAALN